MLFLRGTVLVIDRFTERCGVALGWLCLAMTVVTCVVVLMRYGFDMGFVALQESVSYMHATVFMLGAAFTLKHGGHVRVDIFYRRFKPRTRAWVDSIGAIVFLLPFCLFMAGISWTFVMNSWAIHEGSAESAGIQAVYLLKTLLLLMAANLFLQGLAETLRNALRLVDGEPDA